MRLRAGLRSPGHRWVGGDAELCWRAQLAGHTLAFVPDAVVHYRYRDTTLGAVRQQFEWGQADPRLYCDFRAAGCPRRPWLRMAASAAKVVRHSSTTRAHASASAARASLPRPSFAAAIPTAARAQQLIGSIARARFADCRASFQRSAAIAA